MSEHFLLVAFKLVIVALGGFIVYTSYGAHKRMSSRMMLIVAFGFSLITLGSVVEGILFEIFGYTILDVHIIDSAIVLAGLLVLNYSLMVSS